MASYTDLAKKFHDKATEFGVHLASINTLNDEVKVRTEKLLVSIEKLMGTQSIAAKISCSVCYTRERTHAILPCGHAGICEGCATRAQQRNRCFTCRGRIEEVVRIYL